MSFDISLSEGIIHGTARYSRPSGGNFRVRNYANLEKVFAIVVIEIMMPNGSDYYSFIIEHSFSRNETHLFDILWNHKDFQSPDCKFFIKSLWSKMLPDRPWEEPSDFVYQTWVRLVSGVTVLKELVQLLAPENPIR